MNLDSYLKRIGWSGELRADEQTLRSLHFKHATAIPFENLDIQLGRNISLDIGDLQRKIVENRRGGYCFEQNTLLHAALHQIGFKVVACEARVRMGRAISSPRTHMLLLVTVDGTCFLADVGFGGDGLLLPVPLDGKPHEQYLWKYRIKAEGNAYVLQTLRSNDLWMDLYAFLPEEREAVDFQVANWFTSTHPNSKFVQTLTVQMPTPEARYILRNKIFSIQRGDREETREVKSKHELFDMLEQIFDLHFPPDTTFRNPVFEK